MSKYIKLEDAIEKCKTIAGAGYKWLSDIPTIEVSEEVLKATKNFNVYTIADENADMGMRTQIEPIIEVSEDCIDRKKFIEVLGATVDMWAEQGNDIMVRGLMTAWTIANNAPSVVPTERTGEWKHTMTYYPYCSECEWMPEEDEMTHGRYNYCPNCGAKMKGAE